MIKALLCPICGYKDGYELSNHCVNCDVCGATAISARDFRNGFIYGFQELDCENCKYYEHNSVVFYCPHSTGTNFENCLKENCCHYPCDCEMKDANIGNRLCKWKSISHDKSVITLLTSILRELKQLNDND